jgi:hypothetical protein
MRKIRNCLEMSIKLIGVLGFIITFPAVAAPPTNGVLNKQQMLDRQTWWDNRDWDWYKKNIPFLETPDRDIDVTYYYRFDMMTKHIVYGSPQTGYTLTEFIDRPGWSGTYGAISCPLGLQFSDLRWLKERRVARDYARYWFHTPGAQPRNYSNWFSDAMWDVYESWGDREFILAMLPDMIRQYKGWEARHFKADMGMFEWNGMQDGMETNINSRQTNDSFRGAEGYRPTLNSYLYADALAISKAARLAGDEATATEYAEKAAALKKNVQEKLWDPKREFFFHMFSRDEKDGVKANTLTYQTGKYAGDSHGRELIGYVPWQFNLPDAGYEMAWKKLMDPDAFFAKFGPTTVERHDPLFLITRNCCVWSGNSWPYASSQTLEAMANLLNNYQQEFVTRDDYLKLLKVYAVTHRHQGKPFIAESLHPDTGVWQIQRNHGEHYFHSSYPDLIITGLAGLRPRADDTIEVNPLIPADWDNFALDDVSYHGHNVSIVWDRDGSRYNKGRGLSLIVDGKLAANAPVLGKLAAKLPAPVAAAVDRPINFAVNNDGNFFPNLRASFSNAATPLQMLNDGAYWYLVQPANRWTTEGSPNKSDSLELNLGAARPVESLKVYFLDDGETIVPPETFTVDFWDGNAWQPVRGETRLPAQPAGRRPNSVVFAQAISAARFRITFTHQPGAYTGLTEIEAWGHTPLPLSPPTEQIDDLAYNAGDKPLPKATASFTSRFDKVAELNDGKIFFTTNSRNRWTAYESPNPTDWVQIDLAGEQTVGKADIYLWGDAGGVRAPKSFRVQYWDGSDWADAKTLSVVPATPKVSMINSVQMEPVKTSKIRVTFLHDSPGRTGVTELMLWEK